MAVKVKMLSQYCKGCGYCIHFCPKKVLSFGTERNQLGYFFPIAIDVNACIGCGICALMCPDAALEIREEVQDG